MRKPLTRVFLAHVKPARAFTFFWSQFYEDWPPDSTIERITSHLLSDVPGCKCVTGPAYNNGNIDLVLDAEHPWVKERSDKQIMDQIATILSRYW